MKGKSIMTERKIGYRKIYWLLTEPIPFNNTFAWDQVEKIGTNLINAIAAPEIDHEILSPRKLLKEIEEQIKSEQYSVVINVAAKEYTDYLKGILPEIPTVRFPISRVRDAETITTYGYYTGLTDTEFSRIKNQFDMSHPLLFDDAGHTGGTQKMVMEMLDIDPKTATHAFLMGNNGIYEGKPALLPYLRESGAIYFCAKVFESPKDKIWHIEDLHGGKRLKWSQQVNPLLSTQEKFKPFIRMEKMFSSDVEVKTMLLNLQSICEQK